jgi:Tfp pilus assembly protein PilF
MDTIKEAINHGIAAVNRGDIAVGKQALGWVLRQEPKNRLAWIWMACCVDEDEAKSECYRLASVDS